MKSKMVIGKQLAFQLIQNVSKYMIKFGIQGGRRANTLQNADVHRSPYPIAHFTRAGVRTGRHAHETRRSPL